MPASRRAIAACFGRLGEHALEQRATLALLARFEQRLLVRRVEVDVRRHRERVHRRDSLGVERVHAHRRDELD